MRKKYSYYSDWEKLFVEEDATKITHEILPKIRRELLQKKGIFSDAYQYNILESHFDVVLSQLKKFEDFERTHTKGAKKLSKTELIELERIQMKQYREEQKKKNKTREDRIRKEKQKLEREEAKKRREEAKRKREEAIANGEDVPELEEEDIPEDEPGEPEQDEEDVDAAGENSQAGGPGGETGAILLESELFPDQVEELDDVSFTVKNSRFYFDYEIAGNSKLVEYFTVIKRGLRSLLVCGKISDTSLFTPSKVSQKDSLIEICSLLPTVHCILQGGEFCQEKVTDFQLRNILKNLTVLGVAYDDLAFHMAQAMTIARRSELMKINEL
jgi:hypothetical protein